MKRSLQARLGNVYRGLNTKAAAVGAALMLGATGAMAQTTGPFDAFFEAIALDGIAAKVIAAGLIIVAIALAFKGPSVAKRVVNKV